MQTTQPIEETTLTTEHAARLLSQQASLQAEARRVIAELDPLTAFARVGRPQIWGSYITGLMAWRDLDINVVAPGLRADEAFDVMRPLLSHPQVTEALYKNNLGQFSKTGLPADDRAFFMVKYLLEPAAQPDVAPDTPLTERLWKVDVSFWTANPPREETLPPEALISRITEETRLAILWIKDVWLHLPEYRTSVYSVDIYRAVLDHGVRSPEQFAAYLAARPSTRISS